MREGKSQLGNTVGVVVGGGGGRRGGSVDGGGSWVAQLHSQQITDRQYEVICQGPGGCARSQRNPG